MIANLGGIDNNEKLQINYSLDNKTIINEDDLIEALASNKVAGIENDDQVDKHEMIEELQIQMLKAAEELEFEKAAQLRDKIATLKGEKVATPQIKKKRFKKR